jgi:protoporphyrinogen oxidase
VRATGPGAAGLGAGSKATRRRRVRVAIIGSGPSGLAAAWRLERSGERNYVVLELESRPGGTSTYGADGVVPYPWGAHYVPVPLENDKNLIALLDEMGALERDTQGKIRGRERLLIREPEERVFYRGSWHEGLLPMHDASAQDRADLAKFEALVARWVDFRDAQGRRAFVVPVSQCSDAAEVVELDRISAEEWLTGHGILSKRVRWYVDYACRDDYGLKLESASAWAMLFYFAARVERAGAESQPFLTWPEGNGRVVRHLADVAGRRLSLGRLVTDIAPNETCVEVTALDLATETLERYDADYVIVAVPKFVARHIVRPLRDAPPEHLREFSYGPWLVANLHLSERPQSRGFPFAWDNVLYQSPSLGYVVATHQTLRDRGPTIWTYYLPFSDESPKLGREKLLAFDERGLSELVLEDLERAHQGLSEHLERIEFWRYGHAMIRPVPGFVWGSARRRAAQPLGRVHFAHSDLSGVALLEEALDHGVRAADEVAAKLAAG